MIRWLHISDLHMGCRGEEVWWQVRSEFRDSIRAQFQPVDMILVSGDVTYSATPEQFEMFDRFLDELLGWLRDAGQEVDPLVIPVPGNHDLAWPAKSLLRNFRVLDRFENDPDHEDIASLRDELWVERDAAFFDPVFGTYATWLDNSILPRFAERSDVSVRRSHFPGDLSIFVNLQDRPPIAVVGLNSAWTQYMEGDFERRIELFTQQLGGALGSGGSDSPLDALDGRLNLLIMHHPPDWLSGDSRRRFEEEIYTPDRFLLCLHGHMHEGRSQAVSQSGGKFRYFFQAPSLFGLERYGKRNEDRAMGYAWGAMDAEGTVRVWPFIRRRQGGEQIFAWDTEFAQDPNGHRLRPLVDPAAAAVSSVDLAAWLEALLDRTGYIEISGIGSGVGRTRDASRYPIEQLYTALRSRETAEDPAGRGPGARGGSVSLAELMSLHDLLLIEGQPGAGKTTFLHLVAAMLARDLLRRPCPGGSSWRERHLGMDGRAKPLVPLFLRLSALATLLTEVPDEGSSDDHRRLLDLLARTPGAVDGEEWRRHWEGLLERGEAILLLDGLDEVANDRLRERVFTIFRDACRNWKKAPMVVTSRPFGVEAVREMGFHHAVIEDFGKEEVQEFIQRWVAALHSLPIGERPGGAAGAKSDAIIQTVFGRPAIRRLAANPVMLTCLCVVHWNEGDLPEGRARLYRAVIHWLIRARTRQRDQADFNDQFTLETLAALAFAMMGGETGAKKRDFPFEAGAEAVLPMVERQYPNGIAIRRARAWLRFECLWSGIVEEPAPGEIRFWHFTFQEYLVALELAWRRDEDGTEDWWRVIRERLDDPQWHEVVDLLPGVLFDEGGRGRVDLLLKRVIGLRGDAPALAEDARVFGIIGRILGPMTAYQYRPTPDMEALYRQLRDRIMPIFESDGAAKVPVSTRIEAAEALGWGGDPRLEQETFIEVPGTDGVSVGKYLVTVKNYDAFVEAGGYREPEYWDEEGWRLRGEQGWTEPLEWEKQLGHPNRPVTGVSWYEADAYCRWRSAETDGTVRLAREDEWELAASPDGREHPWGSAEPDDERANFDEKLGHPTPVGVYPAGDGPYGHCDLEGNVWEWMVDVRRDSKEEALEGEAMSILRNRVLRGGSWLVISRYLRSADRIWLDPDDRVIDVGFRVARTL